MVRENYNNMNTKSVTNNDIYFNSTLWWFDGNNEDSYSIFNLDSLYNERYFQGEHLSEDICEQIVKISKQVYTSLSGKELRTVLEAGSGGGWITKKYMEANIDIVGIEGSSAGYNKCQSLGLTNVRRHDLRTPLSLSKKFNMVISTEVAEHIEPPFVGTYVKNLTDHSDLIWFSYNPHDAHLNHSNCMPEKYWTNVFSFFGFEYIRALKEYKHFLNHRLDGFFYNPNVYNPDNLKM